MSPGDKVRLKANPGRIGILGNETDGPIHRQRVLVTFMDGDEQFILLESLEKVDRKSKGPFAMISQGRYGRVSDLRGAITFYRLSGRLANLIYSLNTTNTQFFAYQFKPVLNFLDSPCNGILIADEVGLGKTIEAGLIWTELKAREDAKRLLVICPAMLREKWQVELYDRFGVEAEIVDAHDLLNKLEMVSERPNQKFALISSMQGLRPSKGWNDEKEPSQSPTAKLARFLQDVELDEHLIDMVIIDEAHYMRNEETATNRLGRLLRPVAQSMVLLSATPIQLRNTDLFNLLHLLDEEAFPYDYSFEMSIRENAPIVALRDKILRKVITSEEFTEDLQVAVNRRYFQDNSQIDYLINNPPSTAFLASSRGRSELANTLDRINPLTKVVTRTLKRDVHEMRVQREPVIIRVSMNPIERNFYRKITQAVRNYCSTLDISEGFLLTVPQRQLSSCMAAANYGWYDKVERGNDILNEQVYELYGAEDEDSPSNLGGLLKTLINISQKLELNEELELNDSKYELLAKNLITYWEANPNKKVILFSFYRNTLHYLARRLAQQGISSLVLHGGMDKQAILNDFASVTGPNILLASEVASEGLDLQFSSLLINYDLPWNPARIEQRIGRIDRIGQLAKRILIWNIVYENTIDEKIYDRLLERLNIFKQALGSMEVMLGDEIRTMSYELLSHDLTPEQELERIDLARIAIENVNRQQSDLERDATQLIAHGDFIQNKVNAANELGRYIRGEDLFAYVKDCLNAKFEGSRLISSSDNYLLCTIELSIEARLAFLSFLELNGLQGVTRILSATPPQLLFDNRHGRNNPNIERITQEHPLVQFAAEILKRDGEDRLYCSVSAVKLSVDLIDDVSIGDYVFTVTRWAVSGAKEVERLEYLMKSLDTGDVTDGEKAEYIVNMAALHGEDWLGASNVLDHNDIASLLDSSREELELRFKEFHNEQSRINHDRVSFMTNTLELHLDRQSKKHLERIQNYNASEDARKLRMIPAEEGKLKKLNQRIETKISELQAKAITHAEDVLVSCGVIRIL